MTFVRIKQWYWVTEMIILITFASIVLWELLTPCLPYFRTINLDYADNDSISHWLHKFYEFNLNAPEFFLCKLNPISTIKPLYVPILRRCSSYDTINLNLMRCINVKSRCDDNDQFQVSPFTNISSSSILYCNIFIVCKWLLLLWKSNRFWWCMKIRSDEERWLWVDQKSVFRVYT